ncbi:hypothetical protein T4B_646 [Trichinella pseudospiralis]|uniref:Uncharacterized protein n=1 Tax=Trichinella pseudospiralis TaxID=6337 RepID=A0A0V1G909_TRIPS|nr:hypothetical protein T4B_646 [Trichinella pseudospiralis]
MELKAFKQNGTILLTIKLTQLEEERDEYRCNVCLS